LLIYYDAPIKKIPLYSGHIIIVFVKHIVGDHTYNLGMIL
jgi:hypothetical protein